MFTLVRKLPVQRLLLEQLAALVIAFAVAEVFYRFHSFTVECAAFLVRWFAIDAAVQFARRLFTRS